MRNLISILLLLSLTGKPPDICGLKNTTTRDGENISYDVFYALGGIYVKAGWANFSNKLENFKGHPVYHVVGAGGSNKKYDWIYKVNDSYESFIDTSNMKPLRFSRNVQESNRKYYQEVTFNRAVNTAVTEKGVVRVPECVHDVLSIIYLARNIDFSGYQPNDKINFDMFLDGETHHLYIRYLGKERVKTRYGVYNAIRFRPLLVEGTLFSGGENMNVWVTDDRNHVPVRIETPILVGRISVDLKKATGLRYTPGS